MRKFILALLVFFSILLPVKALAVTFDLSFTLFNQLGEKKEPIANVETVFSGTTQKTDDSGTVTFKDVDLPVGQQRATLAITVGGKTYSAQSEPFLVEENTTRIGQPITFTNIPKEALQAGGDGTSGIIKYTSPDLSPIFKGKQYETLGDYLTDLIKVAMVLSVVAATLVVVYAGFDYLNSGGSPEGTAHAKEMIAGALIGIATVFMMSAFLVSLYDKKTLENLAPPAETNTPTGQTTDRKQLLASQLNTKLEQLKTLARNAGVALTPAQEEKIKSSIEKSATEGKPDALKKAIQEVANDIAKQKPPFKPIVDRQIGTVLAEVDKVFAETPSTSNNKETKTTGQTKITRVTTPDCPTITKGVEGIIRLEGCRAANRVASELRSRPKKETCDKEIFTTYALKQNKYDPATDQSSFDNFNTGFIEQCKKIRGTS